MPSHRVSQPIIDIEQERDFQCFPNRLLGHARTHHRAHVFGSEAAMIECHLLEQPKCGAKPFADRRCRVLVQDLLNQETVVERGRRDRGVGIRSKVALIHARHECGEELALAHRPFGGTPHDDMRVRGVRPSKEMRPVSQGSYHIRCTEAGDGAHEPVEQSG